MKKPFLIIIDGSMGAGKTTVANLLHKTLKRTALISLDKLKRIVSFYEMDSKEHLQLASDLGVAMTNEYLKKEINVIVEKAFTREEYLKSFIKSIKNKPNLYIYQIEVPLEIGLSRVKKREKLKEKGIPRNRIKEKVTRNYSHYNQFKYSNAKIFDSSKLTPRMIANKILKEVGSKNEHTKSNYI